MATAGLIVFVTLQLASVRASADYDQDSDQHQARARSSSAPIGTWADKNDLEHLRFDSNGILEQSQGRSSRKWRYTFKDKTNLELTDVTSPVNAQVKILSLDQNRVKLRWHFVLSKTPPEDEQVKEYIRKP